MELQAKFLDGRVYFGMFDKDNDINPKTQRSGLNYYRYHIIGLLLYFLGFAHKVKYIEGAKQEVVFLHPNSFTDWKNKHAIDAGLNVNYLNQIVAQKNIEKAIKIICKNFVKNKNLKNIPLPQEVLQKTPEKEIVKEIALDGNKQVVVEKEQKKEAEELIPLDAIKPMVALPEEKNRQIPAIAFGKEDWAKLGLEVRDIPLPENIDEILKSPCPFSKDGKTVEETHLLVLRPGNIHGEILDIDNFGKLMKSNFPELNENGYVTLNANIPKLGVEKKPYWILMKKEVLEDSKDKSFAEQQNMIEEKGQGNYQVPETLDAVVCIMAEYARSKVRLFNDTPIIYTHCQEKINGYQLGVGNFKIDGLCVDLNNAVDYCEVDFVGIAPIRKL